MKFLSFPLMLIWGIWYNWVSEVFKSLRIVASRRIANP